MRRNIKRGAEFLGIDEKEAKIIEILKAESPLRPVDIARKTEVGRTTVNFLLKKLQKRGILTRDKIKNHYEWKLFENSQIKYRIENLYDFFEIAPIGGHINLSKDIGIEVFKDKEQILKTYENIIKTAANKRIFFIQGNKSVRDSIKFLPQSYIERIQEWYRQHKVILDGVAGESTLELLKILEPKELKVYRDRLAVAYIIEDDFINFNMDIIIVGKTIVMLNYGKSLLLVIKNEEICDAILNMIETMKTIAKKIDLNKFIRELIETKK